MLRILLKKQLAEVFRGYFFNAKKNTMRSKWAIAVWFVFFVLIMVGMLGGIFTALAFSMCGSLCEVGMGWLYFLLMSLIAVFLGAFGSVFNTYSGLYLAKDNDLLLSMPIPVRSIVAARLLNVYLLGTMYSAVVLLPTLIVYWIVAGVTAARVLCGMALFLIVTAFVLFLSCVLGWVVAKVSLKLKNKSFFTVFLSLLFIGAYYFFYFKANDLIRDIIRNAGIYGEKVKGAAYGLYLFGRVGEGDGSAAGIFLGAAAVGFAAIWTVLLRSFLSIATASQKTGKVRYIEKRVKKKTVFGAMFSKELARFTASPNYMLNCGLAILLIPAFGVFFLLKGAGFQQTVSEVFSGIPDAAAVLFCSALCLLSSMNDMVAPSISLEGKSIWIPQSLPIEPRTVLRAKVSVQLLLTGVPMLFAAVCVAVMLNTSLAVRLLVLVMPLVYTAFSALAGMVVGVKMPVLNWTSELAPIKQSGAVVIALFGGWAICITFGALYLFAGYQLGALPYLALWTLALAAASLVMLRWLDRGGSRLFARLA